MIAHDVDQGSDEWQELRIGSIGGSSISKAVAKGEGKSRTQLMYDLVGELLSGQKKQGYTNSYMDEGIKHEAAARDLYSFTKGVEVEQTGVIKLDDHRHYSPDGIVNPDGLIEIKTVIPSVYVEILATGKIQTAYRRQMQWGLYITGRAWCDYCAYCPYVEERAEVNPLHIILVERDEKEIAFLRDGCDLFIQEMLELYERVRVA